MWKNIALIATFFTLAPIALVVSIFTLTLTLTEPEQSQVLAAESQIQPVLGTSTAGVQVYASLPNTLPTMRSEIESADARVEILRQYYRDHNSPLIEHAEHVVAMADKYELDFRLITAIARQESNLCKIIPPESHNCWGWGIHSKGSLGFKSFEEGIEVVSRGLRYNYIDQGYVTVDEIMDKWVPHSPERAWAKAVNEFMAELE